MEFGDICMEYLSLERNFNYHSWAIEKGFSKLRCRSNITQKSLTTDNPNHHENMKISKQEMEQKVKSSCI